MQAAGRAPGTIRLHRHYLSLLARSVRSPTAVTTSDLREVMSRPDWSPETRKSARSVYRRFFSWLKASGAIDRSPAARLEPVRVPQGAARPAPDAVIHAAMVAADDRVTLMLMLAAYAGLRCAEIAQVRASDLDADLLRVKGKGGKTRLVPVVHAELLRRLADLDGWAFPGKTGGHLSPAHVSKLLSRALPGGWTGHTLRHRMATRAYAGTRDLLAVGAILGHSRPETTQRYVRMPDDALREAARSAVA